MQAKDYDVFISCKSEDYVYAEEIYDYLVANGFNAFLASKELRKLGDSEYRKAITSALRSAYHLIIFASKAEYIESKWVYYEWDMFVNAKLNGFKDGNIFTILKDVPVREISMDLWKYESMTLDNYKDTLLGYVETPEHREKNKAIQETRRLKTELRQAADEYNKQQAILSTVERRKITSILRKLGVNERSCPVCGTKSDIDDTFCPDCGWAFNPVEGIKDSDGLYVPDQRRLDLYHKLFAKAEKNDIEAIEMARQFEDEINFFKEKNEELSTKLEKANRDAEIRCLARTKELTKDLDRAKEEISRLAHLKNENMSLSSKLAEATRQAELRFESIKKLSEELDRAKLTISRLEKSLKEKETPSPAPEQRPSTTPSSQANQRINRYNILFRVMASGDKLSLVKFIKDVTGLELAEAKKLVDSSYNQFASFKITGTQDGARRVCSRIMDIIPSTATYTLVR